jgi:hypothetical protein
LVRCGRPLEATPHRVPIPSFRKTLGGYQCLGGDVLYCALEDNKRRMKKRLAKQRPGETPPAGLFLTPEMPRLAEGGVDYIRDWLKKVKQPRLVIIDTLAVVRTPLSAIRRLTRPITKHCWSCATSPPNAGSPSL